MVLHTIRRQDDALSCHASRCIYSIDSFKSTLWILWLLVYSFHFHHSTINLEECLPCIIVTCCSMRLLWKPVSCRRFLIFIFFLQDTVGTRNQHQEGHSWLSLCKVSTTLRVKGKRRREKCTQAMEQRSENKRWGKYLLKENSPVLFYTVVFEHEYVQTYLNTTL